MNTQLHRLLAVLLVVSSSLIAASGPASGAGSVAVEVLAWDVDDVTGGVHSEISLSGTRCPTVCSVTVRGFYGSQLQESIGGANVAKWTSTDPLWTATLVADAGYRREIDGVQAVMTASGTVVASSPVVSVPDPFGSSVLELNVKDLDRTSGSPSAWLSLNGWWLGGVGDVCEARVAGCYYNVESGHESNGAFVRDSMILSGSSSSGTSGMWYLQRDAATRNIPPQATLLRATLTSYQPGRETLTDQVPIGSFMAEDTDLTDYVAPVGAVLADQGCDPLLFSPINTDTDSVPDAYEACEEAVLAGLGPTGIMKAVAAAGGIASVMMLSGDAGPPPLMDPPRTLDPYDPGAEEHPEPQPAGAGAMQPPSNCMNDTARDNYLGGLPTRIHHLASNKGIWKNWFQDLVARYGLGLDSSWNKLTVPHSGKHAPEYHEWVTDNIEQAKLEAGDDVEEFKRLFNEYVARVVDEDPSIVNYRYWECYR